MKVFGSSRRSKHAGGHVARASSKTEQTGSERSGKKKSKKLRWPIIVIIVLLALIASAAAAVAIFWFSSVKPPDVTPAPRPSNNGAGSNQGNGGNQGNNQSGNQGSDPSGSQNGGSGGDNTDQPEFVRNKDKFTFLAVGMDDGNGNTDTIMVATFDTKNYTLDIVSIPRDTLVNVSWSPKKINSVYGRGGVDRLMTSIEEILGYKPDFYGVVELDAFVKLVDAIGGVTFDVPRNMNYDDDVQDLHIHFNKGVQRLSGEDMMKIWRFRQNNDGTGYAEGDIKRIQVQHDLLMAAAKQILDNKNSISITTLADIFINDCKTDLDLGRVTWFAKELLKMDLENMNIMTIPANYFDNRMYPIILVDEWLEMLNAHFNPFDKPIVASQLSVLGYSDTGYAVSTDGVYASENCKRIPTHT